MMTVKDVVEGLLNDLELSAEEAVDQHFSATFRQRIDGSWYDRAALVARIDDLRKVVEHITITVLEELTDGNRYAGRHVVDLLQQDGTRVSQGVFLFAERGPDGRFVRIEESTMALADGGAGEEQDRSVLLLSCSFEALRAAGYAAYAGDDLGEVLVRAGGSRRATSGSGRPNGRPPRPAWRP